MRFTFILTLLMLISAPLAFADPGDSCQANSDCDSGEHCRQQVCVAHASRSDTGSSYQDQSSSYNSQGTNSGQLPGGSNICVTPLLTCALQQSGPSGMACYCNTFRGPLSGFLR
jgi:hypothetical protein